MGAQALLDDALKLTAQERAELARKLIASLHDADEADVADQWIAEAERRQREAGHDPTAFEDWSSIRARIASRLRSSRP